MDNNILNRYLYGKYVDIRNIMKLYFLVYIDLTGYLFVDLFMKLTLYCICCIILLEYYAYI